MRSVLAVVVGYLVFAVASFALFRVTGQDPHADASATFKTFAILFGVLFAAGGGYVAATIARRNSLAHGAAVGFLIALIAAISLRMLPPKAVVWTQISAIAMMAPAAVFGSVLRVEGKVRSR